MTVLDDIILEDTSGKYWYACVSSKTWGSIWGSSITGGVAWGVINRVTSAVASPSLKESVIRWIKHNNFIKHVKINGNTITVDDDWWRREKNTEVIILKSPEGSTFKGVFSDKNIQAPYEQDGGTFFGGGSWTPKSWKKDFAKRTGIKSTTMTIESAIKKTGLKIKTGDTGVDITAPVNAWKKFNGWESSDMYTEREVREMLDKAFQEGYDDGIDDTLDYIDENYELEDGGFDLMDEYDALQEMDQRYKDGFRAAADASHATGEKRKNLAKFYAAHDLGQKILNRKTSIHARTQKELDEKMAKREELRNRAGEVWKKSTDYLRKSM